MLLKIESCTVNKIIGGVAKIAFLGNIPKGNEATVVKEEYGLELFKLQQMHSNRVFTIDGFISGDDYREGDAIIAKNNNLAIGVLTADCVPIILIDVKNRIIATIHAGWRGARYGIIENTIKKMPSSHENREIIAVIGPCIRKDNYEVQQDLVDNFMSENSENAVFFEVKKSKIFFDLPLYVRHKLNKSGVYNIHDIGIDTFSSPSFSSHRREGEKRIHTNISIAMLTNEPNAEQDIFINIMEKKNSIKILKDNHYNEFHKSHYTPPPNSFELESRYPKFDDNLNKFGSEFQGDGNLLSSKEQKQILKNISSGRVKIMNELDLHGYDSIGAFEILKDFIVDNFNLDIRYLLIITGRGRSGDAILKTSFVGWVENNVLFKEYVLTYMEALPNHGGSGAFYLILRKRWS